MCDIPGCSHDLGHMTMSGDILLVTDKGCGAMIKLFIFSGV